MLESPPTIQRQSRVRADRQGEHSIDHVEQAAEIRLRVGALLLRVAFAGLVERRHRGAHARVRQLRRQLAIERVSRSGVSGAGHFCA